MKRLFQLSLYIFISAIVFNGCGLQGFRTWYKGKYFNSALAKDFKERDIKKIGVYVFSDGAAKDAKGGSRGFDGFLTNIYKPGFGTKGISKEDVSLDKKYYPEDVTLGSAFNPDTSNSGPSSELAIQIAKKLTAMGYVARDVLGLGHSGTVSLDQCIKDAKSKNYDAAFVVYYSGLDKWPEYSGKEITSSLITTHVTIYDGFLYIPNAALFAVKDGARLWNNSYYGIVENAHFFNISAEPYTKLVHKAIIHNGDETYIKAAPKAVKLLFEPEYWQDSFAPLPIRGDGKKSNKI